MSIKNNWTIIGNLGRDAEVKTTDKGKLLILAVAVDRSFKDKQGQKVDRVDWVDCLKSYPVDSPVSLADYLKKGCIVQVEGVPYPSAWIDKNDGTAKSKLCISAQFIKPITWLEKPKPAQQQQQAPQVPTDNNNDPLPF